MSVENSSGRGVIPTRGRSSRVEGAGERRRPPTVLRIVAVVRAHRVVQEREEEENPHVGSLD